MQLRLNEDTYDVDMQPLRERAQAAMLNLITAGDASPTASALRLTVKGACTVAMNFLHIEKQDRNDDPIQIMAGFITDLIFRELEQTGLSLTGVKTHDTGDRENHSGEAAGA